MERVRARYDAAAKTLRLLEPVVELKDGDQVSVTIESEVDAERPWLALENVLTGEDGERFARAIEEAFPIEK